MAAIDQALSAKSVDAPEVPQVLNREVIPVLRRCRALINERLDCSVATVGDGVTVSYSVEHSFGTRDVLVQVYDLTTFASLLDGTDYTLTRTSLDEVGVVFTVAPATDNARVLVRT